MTRCRTLFAKASRSKGKIGVSFPDKIIRGLKLAILALILFGGAYVIVSRAVIALEFAQGPSIFVP
jgi:hypothetical protein